MHTADRVTLARLPSGVPVETTIHRYGDGDGPTCYVQAAQHGREINGTDVLRRLHERLTDSTAVGSVASDLDGTLIVVPVADPLTFDRVAYTTPEPIDSAAPNMNRCWPGNSAGTIHERMAARLWADASDADAIIDLHTGSPEMQTHTVYLRGDDASRNLAEAFGTDLLLAEAAGDDADTEWDERNFGGKLRVAATREGIPSITPELGSNKQLDHDAIQTGLDGLLGVFRHLGLLAGDPDAHATISGAFGRQIRDSLFPTLRLSLEPTLTPATRLAPSTIRRPTNPYRRSPPTATGSSTRSPARRR